MVQGWELNYPGTKLIWPGPREREGLPTHAGLTKCESVHAMTLGCPCTARVLPTGVCQWHGGHWQQLATTLRAATDCKLLLEPGWGRDKALGTRCEEQGTSRRHFLSHFPHWDALPVSTALQGNCGRDPIQTHFCTAWISPNYTTSTYAAAGNFMWKKTSLDCGL